MLAVQPCCVCLAWLTLLCSADQFQAVHAPDQVPQRFKDLYNGTVHSSKRLTFGGMLAAADEGISNVSKALEWLRFAVGRQPPLRC